MSISVIVPALNEAANLPRTLVALANWRERGHEILIVDGGSQDDTVPIAESASTRVVRSETGRARQMNTGAAHASQDIFLFLHADTRLPANADRLITANLQASARAWGRFDVEIEGASRLFPLISAMINLRSRLSGIATGDQALFMTRAAYQAVGGFPNLPLMEDVEI